MKWLKSKLDPKDASAPRVQLTPHEAAYAKTRRDFRSQYRWCVDATNMNDWDRVPNPDSTDEARRRFKLATTYAESRTAVVPSAAAAAFLIGWFACLLAVDPYEFFPLFLLVSGALFLLFLTPVPFLEYWHYRVKHTAPYLAVPTGVVHLCAKFDEAEAHIMTLKPSDDAIASLVTARANWNELVMKTAQYSATGSINWTARKDCMSQMVDLLSEVLTMESFLHKREAVALGLTSVAAVESLMGPSVSAAQEAEWVQSYLDKLDSGDAVWEIEPRS